MKRDSFLFKVTVSLLLIHTGDPGLLGVSKETALWVNFVWAASKFLSTLLYLPKKDFVL